MGIGEIAYLVDCMATAGTSHVSPLSTNVVMITLQLEHTTNAAMMSDQTVSNTFCV